MDDSVDGGALRHSQDTGTYTRRRWLIAAVLFVAVIVAFFDRISVAVLFANADFGKAMGTGFDPPVLSLLMTGFILAYGLSSIVLGFLVDLHGPRRCLLVCTAFWGLAMILMGQAASFGTMLACRVGLGFAEGPQFAISNLLVKRWFPPWEQARANSVWMIGSPLGSAIGFPVMIYLVETQGWRMSFLLLAGLNLLVVLPLVFAFIRDTPGSGPMTPVKTQSSSYLSQVQTFIGDWRFWLIVVFNASALVYLWGLNSWLPSYLKKAFVLTPKEMSLYAALPFIAMFFGEISGAILSDRLGRRAIVCCLSMLLAGICIYIVFSLGEVHLVVAAMAVSAFFWGASLPPLFALASVILPRPALAAGVGVYNGIGNIVGAFAPFVMGSLISKAGHFEAGFMVLVAAGLTGSLSMVPMIRRH